MGKLKKIHIVIISGILLVTAFILNKMDLEFWKNTALIVATVVAGWSIAKKAIQSVMMKSFSIELLVTIAVIGALFIGEYVESAAVTFLFLFGAYLEVRTLEKTRSSLRSLIDMAPVEATVVRNGETMTIDVYDVEEGDRVLVRSGEKVAIDGTIVKGTATLNEAAITGESVPATKTTDDKVFSSSILENGFIEVIADRV